MEHTFQFVDSFFERYWKYLRLANRYVGDILEIIDSVSFEELWNNAAKNPLTNLDFTYEDLDLMKRGFDTLPAHQAEYIKKKIPIGNKSFTKGITMMLDNKVGVSHELLIAEQVIGVYVQVNKLHEYHNLIDELVQVENLTCKDDKQRRRAAIYQKIVADFNFYDTNVRERIFAYENMKVSTSYDDLTSFKRYILQFLNDNVDLLDLFRFVSSPAYIPFEYRQRICDILRNCKFNKELNQLYQELFLFIYPDDDIILFSNEDFIMRTLPHDYDEIVYRPKCLQLSYNWKRNVVIEVYQYLILHQLIEDSTDIRDFAYLLTGKEYRGVKYKHDEREFKLIRWIGSKDSLCAFWGSFRYKQANEDGYGHGFWPQLYKFVLFDGYDDILNKVGASEESLSRVISKNLADTYKKLANRNNKQFIEFLELYEKLKGLN